uniref:Uncharacterized protein n=1 Tax=Eutreptiella gymnastica TaxID=73025 RepID=A0A7S1N843_9EUGL
MQSVALHSILLGCTSQRKALVLEDALHRRKYSAAARLLKYHAGITLTLLNTFVYRVCCAKQPSTFFTYSAPARGRKILSRCQRGRKCIHTGKDLPPAMAVIGDSTPE